MSKKNKFSQNNSEPTAPPRYNELSQQHESDRPCQPPPSYSEANSTNQYVPGTQPNVYPYGRAPQILYAPAGQLIASRYPTPYTIYAPNSFDSGARFDISQPVIPPPPPGVCPNAAQMAAMQGHNVIASQKAPNFWFGDEDF